jgi:hypothetical protein
MTDDVEPWEVHSELVLVSPEVYRQALAELPERDPDPVPARPALCVDAPSHDREATRVSVNAVLRYTARRMAQTVEFGLIVLGAIVALTFLAKLLH